MTEQSDDPVRRAILEWLAGLPQWVRTSLGVVIGVVCFRGAWAGRWWGVVAIGILFGLVFLALTVAGMAIEETDR